MDLESRTPHPRPLAPKGRGESYGTVTYSFIASTLHTPDVTRTVNRMLSLGGTGDTDLRDRIADALQGIIAQRLLPRRDGSGLILAAEVLVVTGTARETLKAPQGNPPLKDIMEKGISPYGMQTFEMHIKELAKGGLLDRELAKSAAGF